MKKLVFMFAAAAMFAACQHNGKNAANAGSTDSLAADTMVAGDTLTYEGEGPAADGTYKYSLCLLYTSPSPRDRTRSRMPSSA